MKAVIYEKHDEIDLNYIVNLVKKIELKRLHLKKVNLVIVEVDLFRKLADEGMRNGAFFHQYWFMQNQFSGGIKLNSFKIISSHEIQKEIHLTFDE